MPGAQDKGTGGMDGRGGGRGGEEEGDREGSKEEVKEVAGGEKEEC